MIARSCSDVSANMSSLLSSSWSCRPLPDNSNFQCMNRQPLLQGCSYKYPDETSLEKTPVPDPGVCVPTADGCRSVGSLTPSRPTSCSASTSRGSVQNAVSQLTGLARPMQHVPESKEAFAFLRQGQWVGVRSQRRPWSLPPGTTTRLGRQQSSQLCLTLAHSWAHLLLLSHTPISY